jgi:Amino acid permease
MTQNSKSSADPAHDDDVKVLHSMGYAQELSRRLGRFSNFAISFSIICILSGGINSLAQATSGAGGIAIGLGWPLGCLISGVFGLAMAQIASAYPTAGGLYHWGSILGNRFTGWLTAWFNLLGLVTVLAAINVGTYYFFIGAFGETFGVKDSMTALVTFLAALTGIQALINHYGIALTAKLTDFSGYLIFATAIALAIACLAAAPNFDLSRLFGAYVGGNQTSGGVRTARHCVFNSMVDGVRLHHARGLCADDSEHGRGGEAGLECVLLGDEYSDESDHQDGSVLGHFLGADSLRPGHGDFGVAHDFRVFARRRAAGFKGAG